MPFSRPTLQQIHDRIINDLESRLTSSTPLLLRALLRVLAKVFAAGIHICYGFIVWVAKMIMVTDAELDWLKKHGLMWGVIYKSAEFAVGQVQFTGVETTVIPQGTLVQNDSGSEYETLAIGTITGGIADVNVQATEAGADYNYTKTQPLEILLVVLVSPITGIDDTIEVNGEITGGLDDEETEDYRTRILERIQLQPAGGAAHDYIRWAKEVSGVEDAWCFPLYYGAGTVGVVIYPENPAVIPTVQTYIDARRPVTAAVTVDDITPVSIDFAISIDPNDTDTADAITEALTDLLRDEGKPGGTIPWTHITGAISSSGVYDYDITEVVVGLAIWPLGDDITLNDFEFPVIGDTVYLPL